MAKSGTRLSKYVFLTLSFAIFFLFSITKTEAATTKYKGVDYSRVYNFNYYVEHNSYVKKHYANSPEKALKYFVKKGMKKRQRASAEFDVNSYINGNKDLRRSYKNNYKKYYLHYIKKGYKSDKRKATATGISKMTNYCTSYAKTNYAKVYDFNYYLSKNKKLKTKFGVDDLAAFEYFMEVDLSKGVQAISSFNVKTYRKNHPELQKKFGYDYEKYAEYYVTHPATAEKATTAKTASSASVSVKSDTETDDVILFFDDESEFDTEDKSPAKTDTINGQKTLKSYLHNALVPCGRTLYIWGGGWDDSDASVIGYQSEWQNFFNSHAKSGYDYKDYRFEYGCGLDCSGFAAWTLYNTMYTKSGGAWLVYQSTVVADTYFKKGWCTLAKDSSDQTYKPGDVVSMDGHVWISLGQCSDKSVLIIHSSPNGVQISGTAGEAATLATYYMKKYFPKWPFAARTVGSGYLDYVGKARWKTSGSGSVMRDPDGIQNMTANQVIKLLLGS